jgi:hypothetical protein
MQSVSILNVVRLNVVMVSVVKLSAVASLECVAKIL